MRWLVLGFVLATVGVAAAAPFDATACALDLDKAKPRPKHLADLPSEKGSPPPVVTTLVRFDKTERADLVKKLNQRLPWIIKAELDPAGMNHDMEMIVPGSHDATELEPDIIAFVQAHPCLFGIHDPASLKSHVIVPHGMWVLFDVEPRSVGVLQVDVDGYQRSDTHVRFQGHLWPIADASTTVDKDKMLARYVGKPVKVETGSMYMVDPKTHQHTGCVPTYTDEVSSVSTFSVDPVPILACRAHVLEVVTGAYVTDDIVRPRDAVFDELPATLDLDGNLIGPSIAPSTRAPSEAEIFWDRPKDCF